MQAQKNTDQQTQHIRKQLHVLGVIVVSLVIFCFWVLNIRSTFLENRVRYGKTLSLPPHQKSELQKNWQEFRARFKYLKP